MIIINFILTSFAIAGASVLWRSFLYDSRMLREGVRGRLPKFFGKALTCGLCFTFWLSLFVALITDPFAGWLPPFRFALSPGLYAPIQIFVSWMALGMLSALIRFSYAALSELVHYQVHHVNHKDH